MPKHSWVKLLVAPAGVGTCRRRSGSANPSGLREGNVGTVGQWSAAGSARGSRKASGHTDGELGGTLTFG